MRAGAWYNGWDSLIMSDEAVIDRVDEADLEPFIIKWGYVCLERKAAARGLEWWTERFVYPGDPVGEGTKLANAVDAGAKGIVINAEEGAGWQHELGAKASQIVSTIRSRHPQIPIWCAIDTRGDRMTQAYQRALVEECDGVMPMVYPTLFRPSCPADYVQRAFADCLDGAPRNFLGKPVWPVLQAFAEGQAPHPGPAGIRAQIDQAQRRRLPGLTVYTAAAATEDEWRVISQWRRDSQAPAGARETSIAELASRQRSTERRVLALDLRLREMGRAALAHPDK